MARWLEGDFRMQILGAARAATRGRGEENSSHFSVDTGKTAIRSPNAKLTPLDPIAGDTYPASVSDSPSGCFRFLPKEARLFVRGVVLGKIQLSRSALINKRHIV